MDIRNTPHRLPAPRTTRRLSLEGQYQMDLARLREHGTPEIRAGAEAAARAADDKRTGNMLERAKALAVQLKVLLLDLAADINERFRKYWSAYQVAAETARYAAACAQAEALYQAKMKALAEAAEAEAIAKARSKARRHAVARHAEAGHAVVGKVEVAVASLALLARGLPAGADGLAAAMASLRRTPWLFGAAGTDHAAAAAQPN